MAEGQGGATEPHDRADAAPRPAGLDGAARMTSVAGSFREPPLTLERFVVLFVDWVAEYNMRRPHDGLGGRTPLDAWMSDARRTVPRPPPGALWGWMRLLGRAGRRQLSGRLGTARLGGVGLVGRRRRGLPALVAGTLDRDVAALVETAHAALLDQP